MGKLGTAARIRLKLEQVILRDGPNCWLCGRPVGPSQRSTDHAIPRSRGGTHDVFNLRLAHRDCNSSRGAIESARFSPPRAAAVRAYAVFNRAPPAVESPGDARQLGVK